MMTIRKYTTSLHNQNKKCLTIISRLTAGSITYCNEFLLCCDRTVDVFLSSRRSHIQCTLAGLYSNFVCEDNSV